MAKSTNPFRWFGSSPEVIRLVVLMYVKYPLSLRNVEELVAERRIDICHETVWLWWNRFGAMFAAEIRRRRVQKMRRYTHWRWHLDEVCVRINGKVLESLVTKTRDKAAALNFIKKTLKRLCRPKAIVTDGLRPYRAAMNDLGISEKQVVGRWPNNRCENSHLTFRRRERAMLCVRQMKALQKFSSVRAAFQNDFNQDRRLISRDDFKARRSAAYAEWKTLAG